MIWDSLLCTGCWLSSALKALTQLQYLALLQFLKQHIEKLVRRTSFYATIQKHQLITLRLEGYHYIIDGKQCKQKSGKQVALYWHTWYSHELNRYVSLDFFFVYFFLHWVQGNLTSSWADSIIHMLLHTSFDCNLILTFITRKQKIRK